MYSIILNVINLFQYFFKHYCDVVSKELNIFIQSLDRGDYWKVLDQFTGQKVRTYLHIHYLLTRTTI